ncbi:hypothetical protein FOA52_006684 [Chlamydomonas sp. UWO 241]|nr:hypothetical protein FOA52_006684 [Chlamydomonas sp. UWO 241]
MLRTPLQAQRPSLAKSSHAGLRPIPTRSSGPALRVLPLIRATPSADPSREWAVQDETSRRADLMRPHESRTPSPAHEGRVAAALQAAEGLAKTAVTLAAREHAQAGGEELIQLMRTVAMRLAMDAASPAEQQVDRLAGALESLAGSSQRTEALLSDMLAALQLLLGRTPSRVSPVAVGQIVRVRGDLAEPAFGWGGAERGMRGVVRSIAEEQDTCLIDFPQRKPDNFWRAMLDEVVPNDLWNQDEEIDFPALVGRLRSENNGGVKTAAFELYDLVRDNAANQAASAIPALLQLLEHESSEVQDAAACALDCLGYKMPSDVTEEEEEEETAEEKEAKKEEEAKELPLDVTPLQEGVRVRVRTGLLKPTFGWGGVESGSVGVVTYVLKGGDCRIDFPEFSNWRGKADELQLVSE